MAAPRRTPTRRALAAGLVLLVAAAAQAAPRVAPCSDAEPAQAEATADVAQGERALRTLVDAALERSHAVGVSRALADAAVRDLDEARSALDLQASASANLGPLASHADGRTASHLAQGGVSLSVSRLLWDGGRQQKLVDWRAQLAEAARQALLSQREQLALGVVSVALDRSRYHAQVQVYGRYVAKMACLVDALQAVVAADRGRASELVQARKALQQAELSRTQTQSLERQAEIRLRRLLGDTAPAAEVESEGSVLGAALPPPADLQALLAAAERASEVAQLQAQAGAAEQLAQSLARARQPRLSWSVNVGGSTGIGGSLPTRHGATVSAGVSVSVPLFDRGADSAADAARWRARASREQLEDTLQSRRARVLELHEQALSTADRAERVLAVLENSERVRAATLLQWQQLGRRSLFDVMGAESEHVNLRLAWVNARHDGWQLHALLRSLGPGLLGAP